MSTLMTPQERGSRKTKLIKATDSPQHYRERSEDIAVYFHCQFSTPPHHIPLIITHLKSFPNTY